MYDQVKTNTKDVLYYMYSNGKDREYRTREISEGTGLSISQVSRAANILVLSRKIHVVSKVYNGVGNYHLFKINEKAPNYPKFFEYLRSGGYDI